MKFKFAGYVRVEDKEKFYYGIVGEVIKYSCHKTLYTREATVRYLVKFDNDVQQWFYEEELVIFGNRYEDGDKL